MIYRALARLYKYTPDQIASMSPYTQLVMLDLDGETDEEPDNLHFETEEEYLEWYAKRG